MSKVLSTWFKRYLSQPEAVALLIIFIVTILIFKTMGQVLAPMVVSVILSYLLAGVVRQLERWHCSHLLAVIVVFSLFMGALLMAVLWLLPLLWQELIDLVAEVPMLLSRSQALILKLHDLFPDLVSVNQLQQSMLQVVTYLANFGREIVTFSLSSLFGVVTIVVYLVLVPLLVFFFLRDGRKIITWLVDFLPANRELLQGLWYELLGKMRSYLQGKMVEVVVVIVITVISFALLGLKYAILLGALVGLSVLIPYVGIVIVTLPIMVVGLIQWGWSEHFLYLMVVYTVISILDANLLVPILFSEIMNLHPLAIILAVLVFGNLCGFWGVFFAIPLATLVGMVIKCWPKEEQAHNL